MWSLKFSRKIHSTESIQSHASTQYAQIFCIGEAHTEPGISTRFSIQA